MVKTKAIKTPWSFSAPSYDDRNKVGAGDHYGSGIKAKVGSVRSSSMAGPIPKGKTKVPPKKVA